MPSIQSSKTVLFNVYADVQSQATVLFNVFGSEIHRKFFPPDQPLPKPGQYLYVGSDRLGIPLTLVKITSVKTSIFATDLYRVEVEVNRVSLTEEVLFARLARRQVELTEQDEDFTEPLLFSEEISLSDAVDLEVLTVLAEYSGANYSGIGYSGAV